MARMTVEDYLKRLVSRNAPMNTSGQSLDAAVRQVISAAVEKGIDLAPSLQKTHDLNRLILSALDDLRSASTDPKPDERIIVYPNGGVEIVDKIGPGDRGGGGGSGSADFDRSKEKSEPGLGTAQREEEAHARRIEAELDEADLKTLKDIALRDKVVGNLLNDQVWAASISEAMKKTAKGPAKIILVIADSQIDAWGKINRELEQLSKQRTCHQIEDQQTLAIGDNRDGAAQFWAALQRARGCE